VIALRRKQSSMLCLILPEARVPPEHPLRAIKKLADEALKELSPVFDEMYAATGRPSIPPERLLKATLLMALYTVRSERLLGDDVATADAPQPPAKDRVGGTPAPRARDGCSPVSTICRPDAPGRAIQDEKITRRILEHLGLPASAPARVANGDCLLVADRKNKSTIMGVLVL